MDLKQFRENLLIYGTDLYRWPEEIQRAGIAALEQSAELRAALADHEHFEEVLKSRKFEEPGADLAERIISASLNEKEKDRFRHGSFLSSLRAELSLPNAALAAVAILMVTVLLIGFAIGFSNPFGLNSAEQESAHLQEFLYYEGEIL